MENQNKVILENGLEITGATLLTVEEAEVLPKEILSFDHYWWLCSRGDRGDGAAYVSSGSSVRYSGAYGLDCIGAVRPALIINLKSPTLQIGDKFQFREKEFEIISANRALCTESIGDYVFREDWQAEDSNIYEMSDVKKFVDEWYQKQINFNQYTQKEEKNMEISTIMDFGMFQEMVKKEIPGYLPDEFDGADIEINKVNKNNMSLTGIRILKKGSNISPLVYLDDFYGQYTEGKPLPDIMQEIAGFFTREIPNYVRNVQDIPAKIKGICPCLINKDWNRELLDELVSRDIAPDLAVVYRAVVNTDENGIASFLIRKENLPLVGKTEEEIHGMAVEYAAANGSVKNMMEYPGIACVLGKDEREYSDEELLEISPMFIAGYKNGVNGAGMIVEDGFLRNFKEKYGDFYILPSSIHEFLLCPKKAMQNTEAKNIGNDLKEMVEFVNAEKLAVNERLSNNVYEYDFDKKILVYAE